MDIKFICWLEGLHIKHNDDESLNQNLFHADIEVKKDRELKLIKT